ncbi:uncharacterized protein KY384_004629 [Bacidia gigantensis]|uniref:uncharacterized protein n=1 Tax=Bacidia gigantensis TaxID=2732470 RepID=UPI001D04D9E7|nr:uncharacterized protein KY384_004629 [Bacidia gigantensis]KAG8531271.1 hypothetical protein KY384_004629 [Bacidia gigantensis]
MEVLGGVASGIAVVQISSEIAKLCGSYIIEVRDAQEEIERLRVKATAVHDVLCRLKSNNRIDGVGDSIQHCLDDLAPIKQKLEAKKRHRFKDRNGVRALKWPFSKKQVITIMESLEDYLLLFSTHLQLTLDERTEAEKRQRILEKLDFVSDAVFNSYESSGRHRQCLKGTRTQLLNEITNWVESEASKPIFWLKGLAGTGKSTISMTIASILQDPSRICASYFFKRGFGELAYARRLITTLVRQLVSTASPYQDSVVKALEAEAGLGKSVGLAEQFDKLLLDPLLTLQKNQSPVPQILIVIDALDECDEEDNVRLLLRLFSRIRDVHQLHIRIFITSRPEWPIRMGFEKLTSVLYHDLALQNITRSTVDEDIRNFVQHELDSTSSEFSLGDQWPPKSDVDHLVRKAGGLFIFASTACRYIGGSPQADPEERLADILGDVADNQLATEELDQMYSAIIRKVFRGKYTSKEQERIASQFRETVGRIVLLKRPLPVSDLYALFGHHLYRTQLIFETMLRQLYAVLDVPEANSAPVQILHLSFRDFLLDERRCQERHAWVDEQEINEKLASESLGLMSMSLHQNICDLESLDTEISEIDAALIAEKLPQAMQYTFSMLAGSYIPDKADF